jgi:hypothetical protein
LENLRSESAGGQERAKPGDSTRRRPGQAGRWPAAVDLLAIEIAELEQRFHRQFPTVDIEIIHDAVMDEVITGATRPEQNNCKSCAATPAILWRRIRRRIGHQLRSESRRKQREWSWGTEWQRTQASRPMTAAMPVPGRLGDLIKAIDLTTEELEWIGLLLEHEQDFRTMVRDSAIQEAALADNRRTLKRVKDRLRARIKKRLRLVKQ